MGARLDSRLPARCLWARSEGTLPVRADVADAVERAAEGLAGAGVEVEERRPDGLDEAEPLYSRWRMTDDLADLRAYGEGREDLFSPYMRWLFDAVRDAKPDPAVGADAEALGRRVNDEIGDAVLLLPVALTPAFPHETEEVEIEGRRVGVNGMKVLGPSRAISVLRLPAVTVPAGKSEDGLPVGVQVVAPRDGDGKALAVAALLERELGTDI
jgi:amidase